MQASVTTYPRAMIAIHWMTVLFVLTAYVTGGNPAKAKNLVDLISDQIHVFSGLTVFALALLRLPLRGWLPTPAPVSAPAWQRRAASGVQAALYVLGLLVPLAGWTALADKTPHLAMLGAWSLPLPDPSAAWVPPLGQTHEALANLFLGLAGVHAAAALAHHYLRRDDVLVRMWPGLGRAGR